MQKFYETKSVKITLSRSMLLEMLTAYDAKLKSTQVGEVKDFYNLADENGNTITFLIDQDSDS